MLSGFYDFFIVFLFAEGADRPFFIAGYVGPDYPFMTLDQDISRRAIF